LALKLLAGCAIRRFYDESGLHNTDIKLSLFDVIKLIINLASIFIEIKQHFQENYVCIKRFLIHGDIEKFQDEIKHSFSKLK